MNSETALPQSAPADTVKRLHQLLPGVPHVESPFFAKFFSQPEIDDETRRIALELHTKGFAVFDFPDGEILQLADNIQHSLRPRFDFDFWLNEGNAKGISLRLENAWEYDHNVKRLACNEKVIALLSTLYGAQAWPFQTLNFPFGSQQHVHTDSVHFSSVPERFMCGVWIALEDIDEENGPLEYYPGSHQWPIYTNEHIGQCVTEMQGEINQTLYEEMWRAVIDARGAKPQRFYAKKGQALIWAANLMHGGSRHLNKERTRWSQVTHYFFENCAYYTPMTSDPFYGTIAFRHLKNICTGEIMPNMYANKEINEMVASNRSLQQLARDGFNAEAYLAANPDVAEAKHDPYLHFLEFGYKELRNIR